MGDDEGARTGSGVCGPVPGIPSGQDLRGWWCCSLQLQPLRTYSAWTSAHPSQQPQPMTPVTTQRVAGAHDARPGGSDLKESISQGCRGASGCTTAGPDPFPIRGVGSTWRSPFPTQPASSPLLLFTGFAPKKLQKVLTPSRCLLPGGP